jgi:hypothetical protein
MSSGSKDIISFHKNEWRVRLWVLNPLSVVIVLFLFYGEASSIVHIVVGLIWKPSNKSFVKLLIWKGVFNISTIIAEI